MAKWRIVYNGNTPAEDYPDQASLEAVGVVGGIYDDGFAIVGTDPNDPNFDWTTFVNNEWAVPQGVLNLLYNLLPNYGLNGWGANYAWDLNPTKT